MKHTVFSFITDNYYDIMKQVERVTREQNVDKKEVVLELDFHANDQGYAPALQDPPIFKVGITSQYLTGSRPDELDWLPKGTDVYENNIKPFLALLQDQYQRMTSDHLLTIVHYPGGRSGVYRVQIKSEDSKKSHFSDTALDAFRWAVLDSDDSRLCQVYGRSQREYIRARRNAEARQDQLRQAMMNVE